MELDVYHRPNLERAHKVLAQLVIICFEIPSIKNPQKSDFYKKQGETLWRWANVSVEKVVSLSENVGDLIISLKIF